MGAVWIAETLNLRSCVPARSLHMIDCIEDGGRGLRRRQAFVSVDLGQEVDRSSSVLPSRVPEVPIGVLLIWAPWRAVTPCRPGRLSGRRWPFLALSLTFPLRQK